MKISVCVIAHNEEQYIAKCIESLFNQTRKADEIVLILHNSTDKTKEIAEKYTVRIIQYSGPHGIAYARIEGLKHVTGDMILCIDGDSYAANNWIEVMSETLKRNILAGSYVRFKGTFFGTLANRRNKIKTAITGEGAAGWIWGPSFGFWNKDKEKIENAFVKSIELSKQLSLSRNPEDYWLALFMSKEGSLEVTNKTSVTQHSKERNSYSAFKRSRENVGNGRKMRSYFIHHIHGK